MHLSISYLQNYLYECITFVIKLVDKICNFVSLSKSPNQSKDDFENFCNNFELTLDAVLATNSFLIVAIGDFNAKSSNMYTGDTSTSEDSKIEAIASQFRLQQIINEPTEFKGKYVPCINPLNQIWGGVRVFNRLFPKIAIIR